MKWYKAFFLLLLIISFASFAFATVSLKDFNTLLEENIFDGGYRGTYPSGFYLYKSVSIVNSTLKLYLTDAGYQKIIESDKSDTVAAQLIAKEVTTSNYYCLTNSSPKRIMEGILYYGQVKLMHVWWEKPILPQGWQPSYVKEDSKLLIDRIAMEKAEKTLFKSKKGKNVKTYSKWTKQFGTTDYDSIGNLVKDAQGNMYFAGGGNFVTKFTPQGKILWSRKFRSSTGEDGVCGLAIDAKGNIYIAGATDGVFKGNKHYGESDAFVMKLTPNGKMLWIKQFGTLKTEYVRALAVDKNGNSFILGETDGKIINNISQGLFDVFVAKFDTNGNRKWIKQFGSSGSDGADDLAVDAKGNLYIIYTTQVMGQHINTIMAKYDANLNEIWRKQFETLDGKMIVEENGQVYFVGYGSNLDVLGCFLAKYGDDGNEIWAPKWIEIKDSFLEDCHGIAKDQKDNIYIAGSYVAAEKVLSSGEILQDFDVYLIKLDALGNKEWVKQFGTSGQDRCTSVICDNNGNVYLAGDTEGGFDGNKNRGDADAFLLKY